MKENVIVAALSLSMIVSMAPGLAAGTNPQGPVGLLDSNDGLRSLAPEDLDGLEASKQAGQTECGGTAPLETYCQGEDLERGLSLLVICQPGDRFTGVIEVRLIHGDETFQWQCEYVNGQFQDSTRIGPTPDPGEVFTTKIYSYLPSDADPGLGSDHPLSEDEPHGTPGGIGAWSGHVETW